MADQCIVCLENLDFEPAVAPLFPSVGGHGGTSPARQSLATTTTTTDADAQLSTQDVPDAIRRNDPILPNVARIHVCGHFLHDSCLREWTTQANSCPICRQAFHKVDVYDRVGGTLVSSYAVEDRRQKHEFDLQTWLVDNPEDEEEEPYRPCPVCNLADREDVLLLCDACDTPYHTYCIGLDDVPSGHWYCMECADALGHHAHALDRAYSPEVTRESGLTLEEEEEVLRNRRSQPPSYLPRTRASLRQARRRANSDWWQGVWDQISGRVLNALDLDLDLEYQDEDDEHAEAMQGYRRSQQQRQREVREHEQWQQRLQIASRLGARHVFEHNMPRTMSRRVIPAQRPAPIETREERRAWGAFERARESDIVSTAHSRKRKSRSSTAEPEAQEEPERKLKRPRTRRLPAQAGDSSAPKDASVSALSLSQPRRPRGPALPSARAADDTIPSAVAPSFLSLLLREVETTSPLEEDSDRNFLVPFAGGYPASSPAASPTSSGHDSPRASPVASPPARVGSPAMSSRPSSPSSTLSSVIEPIYPPANYSPNRSSPPRPMGSEQRSPRSSPEKSDSETRGRRVHVPDLRQPRPRRAQPIKLPPHAPDAVSSGSLLPREAKESINRLVRDALRPHWISQSLTSKQYADINRNVSRKLYEEVTDAASMDDDRKLAWERLATLEVNRAVSDMKV